MLGEAAQAGYFTEECDAMNGFAIHLIPFSEDVGNVGVFAMYLFIGAPIVFNNMLGR